MIALTSYDQQSAPAEAMAAGFDHHFIKPVDPEALARALVTRVG